LKIDCHMWTLCESCTKRNCKKTPQFKGNQCVCRQFVPIKAGFTFYELAMDNSPIETHMLVAGFNLSPSKGYFTQ